MGLLGTHGVANYRQLTLSAKLLRGHNCYTAPSNRLSHACHGFPITARQRSSQKP